MPKFDNAQIESLKEYLYHSYAHDAEIDTMNYDRKKKTLDIRMINPIFDKRINLFFEEVEVVLSISGNWSRSCETVISLTAEDDFSYLQGCAKTCGSCLFESVYLLFQMLSGDELHIVAKAVFVESIG